MFLSLHKQSITKALKITISPLLFHVPTNLREVEHTSLPQMLNLLVKCIPNRSGGFSICSPKSFFWIKVHLKVDRLSEGPQIKSVWVGLITQAKMIN